MVVTNLYLDHAAAENTEPSSAAAAGGLAAQEHCRCAATVAARCSMRVAYMQQEPPYWSSP